MATTDRIYKLTVDAGQAVRELQKLNTSVGGMDKKFSALGTGIKAFGVALAAGLSVDKLVSGVRGAIDVMDDMGKAAQKVGVSLSVLQDLKVMSDLSGVSFETLQTSIGRMSQAMSGFEGAGKKAGEAMKALGVNLKGDTPQALAQIADQFKNMPDGVQKTALAMEIFGKAGKDMIPFLNQGGDAIKKMAEEADRLGTKFSAVASEQAERFNDALTKIGMISRGLVTQFTSSLLPSLVAVAEQFVEGYKKGEFFSGLGKLVGNAIIFMSKYLIVGQEYLKSFGQILADVGLAAGTLAQGNASGAWNVLSQGMKEFVGVEGRASAQIKELDGRVAALNGQVSAANRGVKDFSGSLGDNGAAAAAKKAADETKRFTDELNGVLHEITALEYELKTGAGWDDYQKFVEKTKDGLRQLYSPEREAHLLRYVKDLSDLKKYLGAVRAAQAQADKDDAVVAENRRKNAEAAAEEARAFDAMVDAIKRSVDPTIELSEQYDNLEKAFAKNAITLAQYTARYKQLEEQSKKALGAIEPEVIKLTTISSILTDNFNSFFENLQRGTADASEAFKRMGQSILAQLARLALNKLFVSLLGGSLGIGIGAGNQLVSTRAALGGVFDRGVKKFASGGVVAAPTYFGMAGGKTGLMGEAGPEAIMPLRRSSNGALGVEATAPVVNVNVVNNASATVSTSQDESGNITVMIENVKKAIANDIRAGGNFLSGAMERTYGVNRAMGAR